MATSSSEEKIVELKNKVLALEYDLDYTKAFASHGLQEAMRVEGEIEEARKPLIESWDSCDGPVELRRMGEINVVHLQKAVGTKCVIDGSGTLSVLVCDKLEELRSFWQNKICDPDWFPLVIARVNGTDTYEEIIDPEDEDLKKLRMEFGDEAYGVVTNALKELMECSPIERILKPELWNFSENRKATLKEAIDTVISEKKRLKGGDGVFYSQ